MLSTDYIPPARRLWSGKVIDLTPPRSQATIILEIIAFQIAEVIHYAGLLVRTPRRCGPFHAPSLDVHSGGRFAAVLWSPWITPPALDPILAAGCLGRGPHEVVLLVSVLVGPLRNLCLVCCHSVAGHDLGRKNEVGSCNRRSTCQFGLVFSDYESDLLGLAGYVSEEPE